VSVAHNRQTLHWSVTSVRGEDRWLAGVGGGWSAARGWVSDPGDSEKPFAPAVVRYFPGSCSRIPVAKGRTIQTEAVPDGENGVIYELMASARGGVAVARWKPRPGLASRCQLDSPEPRTAQEGCCSRYGSRLRGDHAFYRCIEWSLNGDGREELLCRPLSAAGGLLIGISLWSPTWRLRFAGACVYGRVWGARRSRWRSPGRGTIVLAFAVLARRLNSDGGWRFWHTSRTSRGRLLAFTFDGKRPEGFWARTSPRSDCNYCHAIEGPFRSRRDCIRWTRGEGPVVPRISP